VLQTPGYLMSETSDHLRCFVAVHVPLQIREKLRDIQRQLEKSMPEDAVRWTSFEQLHLTLEFLGNVPATAVPQLEKALSKVAAEHRPFKLQAESIGAFSSIRNPRVIWTGITGDIDRLKALQSAAHAAVIEWEQEPETRAYRPHLTLGRVRPIKPRELRQVSQALAAVVAESFGTWDVIEFALMQSKLSPHGAQHSVLATFRLQGLER
jgi:RNA 2',3'-cyclic 3'-phosphodiesterase